MKGDPRNNAKFVSEFLWCPFVVGFEAVKISTNQSLTDRFGFLVRFLLAKGPYKDSSISSGSALSALSLYWCSHPAVSSPRFNLIPKTARCSAPHKRKLQMKKAIIIFSIYIIAIIVAIIIPVIKVIRESK